MNPSPDNAFFANLPESLFIGGSDVESLLLREYGSVFLARSGAVAPDRVVFKDESEVAEFQSRLQTGAIELDGIVLELQSVAAEALHAAVAEAKAVGLSISPRGADSAKRTYGETVGLWASRVEPALDHWSAQGKISPEAAARIRSLSPFEQVSEVLVLESLGLWFAKDLSKSIIFSVAPPGTSQHLSMLAFDVREFADPQVRLILARHGWHQTVSSDLPHFTFLGVAEDQLPPLGLKMVENAGQTFWVPDIPA